jgi:HAD superfamily hydrolase (TIGR01549 family)
MLQNYFFDFDKTLASTGDVSVNAMKLAFEDMNLVVPKTNTILNYMGIPAEISVKEMATIPLSSTEIEQLCARFREIYERQELSATRLYPEVAEMLARLQSAGKQLFIVSSKQTAAVRRNLNHLQIESYFTTVIGCDLVQHYKPAPDGILMLLKQKQLNPTESVMIGDAKYDLQMVKAAGVKTCGVTWDAFDVESLKREHPTFLLEHPLQLVNI